MKYYKFQILKPYKTIEFIQRIFFIIFGITNNNNKKGVDFMIKFISIKQLFSFNLLMASIFFFF